MNWMLVDRWDVGDYTGATRRSAEGNPPSAFSYISGLFESPSFLDSRRRLLKHTPMCAFRKEHHRKRSTDIRNGAVQLTAAGKARLIDELAHLRDVKRRDLAIRIEESNEHGDISDNSEYEELKEELIMADRRIQELEYLLATAELIEPKNDGRVELGSVVTLVD